MASNLLIIVLVVVSLSLTSGYSLSTRDFVSKENGESYVMATSDQESSMVVEDIVKARRLLARFARSEVVVVSKPKGGGSSRGFKSRKAGAVDLETLIIVVSIIAAIVAILAIIAVIRYFNQRHEAKKNQSIEQGTATEEVNGSLETQTSETEGHEKVKGSLETQISETDGCEKVNGSSETHTSEIVDREKVKGSLETQISETEDREKVKGSSETQTENRV